jgi:hypothetical protein
MNTDRIAAENALSRWGMFTHPQGSIVTNCFAHVSRCQSMLNWRSPDSPACGAYGNDDPEVGE